jgi:predicted nucleotide-binding protein (sugar kinase/HSP70/actin superfamily)
MSTEQKTLEGRKLYLPQMSYECARCMAAAFQSVGIDAEPSPSGDNQTYEYARKYLSGDECLPQAVTLGNFIKVINQPNYDPSKTAFLLPTSNGPCRFGHYLHLTDSIFQKTQDKNLLVFSMSSSDGYKSIGKGAKELFRTGWRSVLVSDFLRKLLFKTRPYETVPGSTDKAFSKNLDIVCHALSTPNVSHSKRLGILVNAITQVRDEFQKVRVDRSQVRPLIGVVGEIFCRLNDFSNDHLVRIIERFGGEVWMSDVTEWVWYTNDEEKTKLLRDGKKLSFQMFGNKLKQSIMKYDEEKLLGPLKEEFKGYEEPHHVKEILDRSEPYLPREGAHGEMVMSVGKSIWYYEKGASGVIDISPFTCMNGIICESVYPRVVSDLNGFPIKVFYFDGLQSSVEGDVEIFLELAASFKKRAQMRKGPA